MCTSFEGMPSCHWSRTKGNQVSNYQYPKLQLQTFQTFFKLFKHKLYDYDFFLSFEVEKSWIWNSRVETWNVLTPSSFQLYVCIIQFGFLFLYRLETWATTKCIFGTFFDFQDMLRDTFLITKLIASSAAWSMMSDGASYTFTDLVRLLPFFLHHYYHYSNIVKLVNWFHFVITKVGIAWTNIFT